MSHLLPDFVFHLDLIFVSQDDDARPPLVGIRDHQLRNDRKDLFRPAQDDGVPCLNHLRPAFAKIFDTAFEARRQDADQGADHENAAQGDAEHGEQERPRALVTAHGARIQRAHQPHPDELSETDIGRDAGEVDKQGNDCDQRASNRSLACSTQSALTSQ